MKTCPYCAEDIQDAAIVCKHCGRQLTRPGWSSVRQLVTVAIGIVCSLIAVAAIVLIFAIGGGASAPQRRSTTAVSPGTVAAATAEPLALVAARGYDEYGYSIVEGQIRNTSASAIPNLEVVITWLTSAGEFVKADAALVEYNPLLPGQTSPFKSLTPANPAMTQFTVTFKPITGTEIGYRDLRKEAKAKR